MTILVLDQRQVGSLLPMPECIDVVRHGMAELARGRAIQPLRSVMWLPERVGALGVMPAYLEVGKIVGIKVITVFPGNEGTELDSHQGFVALFEGERGRLLCLADATEITAVRTAAASGVASDVLARPDADVLAILGSGTQARSHLESMMAVRHISEVRVWSKTKAHAEDFVRRHAVSKDVTSVVAGTVEEAVKGAGIVCTTTSASSPILRGAWLTEGTHVNAVGASVPVSRELDAEAVARSRLFVDRRESTLAEAGDFLLAREEGAVTDDHIVAEVGEVVAGFHPGRGDPGEITVFKSTGLGIWDLAAVNYVYRKAVDSGAGVAIELGGERHAD